MNNLFAILFIFISATLFSQDKLTIKRPLPQHLIVMDGDTLAYDILPILPVGKDAEEYWKDYNRAKYFVPKIYYYVIIAEGLLDKYDEDLVSCTTKKERKKYMKKANKELKLELADDIKKMSETRGKFLVQLLYRQTQKRAFDIIAEYRGKGTAKLWQSVSRLGGANLKLTYDAYGLDSPTEMVVRDIEAGIIPYDDHSPKTEAGKEVMKKRGNKRKKKSKEIAVK